MKNETQTSSGKQYVAVQATHYPNGEIVPIAIFFPGGRVFHITRSNLINDQSDSRSSKQTFRIVIGKQETRLFLDNGRWFVLRK